MITVICQRKFAEIRRLVQQAEADPTRRDQLQLQAQLIYRELVATYGDTPEYKEATEGVSDLIRFDPQAPH